MTPAERHDRLVVTYARHGRVGHLYDVRTGATVCGAKVWRTHPTERVPSSGTPCARCFKITREPSERRSL